MAHHLVDGVEIEVIHELAGDHRDRLRSLLGGQHQAGGSGDGARGVTAVAFGDGPQLVTDDLGFAKFPHMMVMNVDRFSVVFWRGCVQPGTGGT
ncbi:hypothetical protein D3C77_640430 [compost metagenome]